MMLRRIGIDPPKWHMSGASSSRIAIGSRRRSYRSSIGFRRCQKLSEGTVSYRSTVTSTSSRARNTPPPTPKGRLIECVLS